MTNNFSPAFLIKVDGQAPSWNISSFDYESSMEGDDLLELQIEGSVDLADDPLLREGKTIEAKFGYPDKLSGLKKFVIKSVEPDFSDMVSVSVTARDLGVAMKSKDVQKIWSNKKYSAIAQALAGEHGLKSEVDDSGDTIANEPQSNVSDWEFLRTLAGKIGFHFWIGHDTLYFKDRQDILKKNPALTLTYQGSNGRLKRFAIHVERDGKDAGRTAALGFDQDQKKQVKHEAAKGGASLGDTEVYVDAVSMSESIKIIPVPTEPANPAKEEKKIAEGRRAESGLDDVEAEAEIIGEPSLKAGDLITISGVGKRFSGNYLITTARHRIADGYSTTLKLKRNAVAGAGQVAVGGEKKDVNRKTGPDQASEKKIKVNPVTREES